MTAIAPCRYKPPTPDALFQCVRRRSSVSLSDFAIAERLNIFIFRFERLTGKSEAFLKPRCRDSAFNCFTAFFLINN
jgi:hypothetical protein